MTALARLIRQRLAHALLAAAALLPATVPAADIRPVVAPDGRTMFELHFLQTSDYPPGQQPGWHLSESQKARMVETMERWAQILRTPDDARVGVIHVEVVDHPTAYASAESVMSERGLITRLQAALQGEPDDPAFGEAPHAWIVLGTFPIDKGYDAPSQQPLQATGFDLASIAFHELAHTLGVMSHVHAKEDSAGSYPALPIFNSEHSLWNRLLRDDQNMPGTPGAPVLCAACDTPPQDGAFDLRQNRGYLTGSNIAEVLDAALPGIPVSMLYPNGTLDRDNMSHLELANSLMSHQYFRNYTGFMEAELALMQDLGYNLDRRHMYGRSVYGSGLVIHNTHGFHARNPEGTAYLPNTYSTATLGMGLHVYGSRNRITQKADLLTQGAGALGIRVDGQENHIIIPAGVKVHGDGRHGSGVQFAYGRDHVLAVAGDIRALGEDGVGIRIDFGNNAYSNERMVRGSYLLCDGDPTPCTSPWHSNRPVPDELAGPLLARLDITGSVAGRHAAVAASATGLVGDIHLMRGARIDGDIRSNYHQVDEQGRLRLTRLTLGRLPDSQGRATEAADPYFRFHYGHRIIGDNLSLKLAGGLSVLDGENTLHDLRIEPAAVLAGAGHYHITGAGQAFINDGVLVPGRRHTPLRIDGDYHQSAGATLATSFDRDGLHNSMVVEGAATLAGTLALRALPDWYETGWQLDARPVLRAQSSQGDYARTVVDLPSPTLRAQLDASGTRLQLWRSGDAYARLGHTAAAVGVGAALDQIVTSAPESMQGLYRGVDFSPPDGFEAAAMLAQMAPTPYAAWAASQLDAMRLTSDALTRQQNLAAVVDKPGWNATASPFANHARRRLDDDSSFRHYGHGLLIGLEHTSTDTPWTFGAHAVFFEQRLKLDSPLISSGRSEQWQLGLHSRYVPNNRQGAYLLAQIRAGAAHLRLDRTVAGAHWQGSSQARWTARNFQAQATTGYLWQLSPEASIGPVAVMDYAWVRQPGVVESGGSGTQLTLAGQRHDNLRASLGLRMQWSPRLGEPQAWQGHVQLTRDQTLMGANFPQEAAFAARPAASFGTNHALASRGAWRLQGGVAHDTGRLRLAAQMEGQLSAHGQHQLTGQVSVGWRF